MNRDSDRLELRQGGNLTFGLLMTVAGLAVLFSPLYAPAESKPPLWVLLIFGLGFAFAGVVLAFRRSSVIFDRGRGTVTTSWGLLVPFKTTTRPLDRFKTVVISREVRSSSSGGGSGSPTRTQYAYPVKLICEEEPPEAALLSSLDDGGVLQTLGNLREMGLKMQELERTRKQRGAQPILVDRPQSASAARTKAERIAKFLGLGICDLSAGKVVTREAATLDQSVGERVASADAPRRLPDPPSGCRTRVDVSQDKALFRIPTPGPGLVRIASLVLVVIIFFLLILISGLGGDADAGALAPRAFILLVALLILLAVLGSVLRALTLKEELTVTPQALNLSRSWVFGNKTLSIPAEELEEVEIGRPSESRSRQTVGVGGFRLSGDRLPGRRVIQARSDRASMEFGLGLPAEELQWLRETILYLLSTPGFG